MEISPGQHPSLEMAGQIVLVACALEHPKVPYENVSDIPAQDDKTLGLSLEQSTRRRFLADQAGGIVLPQFLRSRFFRRQSGAKRSRWAHPAVPDCRRAQFKWRSAQPIPYDAGGVTKPSFFDPKFGKFGKMVGSAVSGIPNQEHRVAPY